MSYENRSYRKNKRLYDEALMRSYFRDNQKEPFLLKGIILIVIGIFFGFVFPYMGI